MELVDYYKLLKIENSADLDTIKKAFRREIALYHPDKNKTEGANVHFNLLVEAFDILSNPEKRDAYNTMLETSQNGTTISAEQQQDQIKEWKKDAKKKSDIFSTTNLSELLLLDLFLDNGLSSLFSGTDQLLDNIGESLGDIFDIF